MWGFVKDEVYFASVATILNNLKDRIRTAIEKLIRLHCRVFGGKSNIALMCAGQKIKHILNSHRV
jgi:hypothetical protein